MFRDRNFTASLAFIFVVGIVLLASMALLPPFLQNLMGYPVITTGLLLAPRGLGSMCAMLLAGRVIRYLDARLMIFAGLLITSFALWEISQFTSFVPESIIVRNGLMQGFGLGFIFVPLSTTAYSTLAAHFRNEAAAMFSLIRNIGSSVGISVVTTLLARNIQINHAELASHLVSYGSSAGMVDSAINDLGSLGASGVKQILNGMVNEQAATISYLNDFRLMTVIVLMLAPLILLMKKNPYQMRARESMAMD